MEQSSPPETPRPAKLQGTSSWLCRDADQGSQDYGMQDHYYTSRDDEVAPRERVAGKFHRVKKRGKRRDSISLVTSPAAYGVVLTYLLTKWFDERFSELYERPRWDHSRAWMKTRGRC